MDSSDFRGTFFGPVTGAISDSWLQIRAKPEVFLLIWLSLSIAPLLILAIIFLQPLSDAITELMKYFQILMTSAGDPTEFLDEYRQAFSRYVGISFALSGLLIVSSSYLGSVLFGTISRFRSREMPTFTGSLRDGLSRFVGFLLSVLLTCLRVFLMYLAGSFIGSILGMAFGDLLFTPLALTGIFLFAGLLRFGLAPFIHLATEVGGRDAIRISRAYFKARRPVVSGLFLVSFVMPLMVFFLLYNLFFQLNIMTGAGRYVLGFILGFFQFLIVVVIVNFTMNNFHRHPENEDSPAADTLDDN